jgi:hypothetical protein
MALPKAVIAKRLFHQEKAAFEGGGMDEQIVELLEKQKAWPWAMPFVHSSVLRSQPSGLSESCFNRSRLRLLNA